MPKLKKTTTSAETSGATVGYEAQLWRMADALPPAPEPCTLNPEPYWRACRTSLTRALSPGTLGPPWGSVTCSERKQERPLA